MNNKKTENISTDDIFNSYAEHVVDDVMYNTDLSNTDIDVERWFNESEYSPQKFRNNYILEATGSECAAQLTYDSKMIDLKTMGILYICASSLKSSNYMFDEIKSGVTYMRDDEIDYYDDEYSDVVMSKEPELKHVSQNSVNSICIYGHTGDIDDEFMSRLDQKLLKKLSPFLKNKFRDIILCGCFDTIEDMQATITGLYEKLSDLSFDSKVKIFLESNVKDDEGRIRNLADLIASGYIKPSIVDKQNMVEFVYKKFDKRMTARLFSKELKIYDGKDLFEQLNENSDGGK